MNWNEELKAVVKGEVVSDPEILKKDSRDASVFTMTPSVVVCPKDSEDIKNLVKWVAEKKTENPELSLTPRAAGTDMSGGPLTTSICVSLTEHLNHLVEVGKEWAVVEPGVYYRDFEKETITKGLLFPSFPASKNICAIGGIINNNAGGEKSLAYGKTIKYVEEVKMVLRDGEEYGFTQMREDGLKQKMGLQNFEGEIYRQMFNLIDGNFELIQKMRPKVTKNSTGYQIWDIWDKSSASTDGQSAKQAPIFDLSKLFVGAQGTLGIMTQAKLGLVPVKKNHGLMVVFLKDLGQVPEIVEKVLAAKPTAFECFDEYTMKLALKYFMGFNQPLHVSELKIFEEFIPEFISSWFKGIPKLTLLIEFEDNDLASIDERLKILSKNLKGVDFKVVINEEEREKYWAIRHESFNLLREKVKDRYAAPFIDDLTVRPEFIPEFLPKLYEILNESKMIFTIAGHIGDGNFHIFPLMNMGDPAERAEIYSVGEKCFDLAIKYGGSISGEHNDGIIRTPYVEKQFGPEIMKIFKQIKEIFDPEGIFNPGKKVSITKEAAEKLIMTSC